MPSPEMQNVIAQLEEEKRASADLPPPSWEQMRLDYQELGKLFPAAEEAVQSETHLANRYTRCFTPEDADPERAVLYLHGGGYTIGGIITHHAITSRLALAAGCVVYALDYRLAPEHPFPAAVEDAANAFRELVGRGLTPSRIGVAGDSAGGGLTLACALALRDARDSIPGCLVPISPWNDLIGDTGWATCDGDIDPVVTADMLHRMTADYMKGGDARTPHASPLHADLRGLPPTLIQVGTAEILLTDSTLMAEKANAAGVDVTLEVEEGAPHVWHHFAPVVPESVAAIERAGAFIREKTV